MPHISIKAEIIGKLFGIPITNSILTTWIVMAVIITAGFLLTRNLALIPVAKAQNFLELIIDGLYNLFAQVTGEKIKVFFPILATFFIFIIASNWIGLLPGVGSIGFQEHEKLLPIFRSGTADLNTTLALALISVTAIQFFGIKTLGAGIYLSKYINFKNPIYFVMGILEIVAEFSKIISFSFRLFGNIFAGEVLLTVIAFLLPVVVIAPLPFLALEIFVGFIQALVFSMLTAVFLKVAVTHEH